MKWFSREKGWGFIRLESGDEIFVHHSDVEGEGFVTLEDDEAVEFTVEEMEKGPRARNVRRPGQEPAPAGRRAEREEVPAAAGGQDRDERGEEDSPGGLRPLAAQLRERLGRHFPGFGG